jgi:DedD protein
MATTASTEASEIRRRGRRRLIGAIVLVVLAVVFIPMVLDSEPRPQQGQLSTDIPPKDTAPLLPPPAPSKAAATTPALKSVIPPETAKAVAAVDPAAVVAPAKAGAQKDSTDVAPPKAQTVAEAPKLEGFAVQVGAFKDEDKLASARQKLTAAKIPHFVERRGDLNRLRAGPYPTREAAEKALASVKAASLDGQVVPLP